MGTIAMLIGTVGLATLGILLCLGMVKLAQAVLPNDPPIDALYGDSLMTRMKALRHEHESPYVVGGKPRL